MSDSSTEKTSAARSTGGKGRPTPKRKAAEALKRRDLIPADRKLAKKQARERQNELWRRQQEAMDTGDERYMPLRDKGRARRFMRDYIDARWSLSEAVLPAMITMILVMMLSAALVSSVHPQTLATIVNSITWITYGLLLASVIETTFVYYRVKNIFTANYPHELWARRGWFYAFSRMIMTRRWRQPRPQVKRGEYPA